VSWSITVVDLQKNAQEVFREDIVAKFLSQHPEHFNDLCAAMGAAQALGLSAATLAGGRTPSPYNDDEVVMLTIAGVVTGKDFNATMKSMIAAGPDAEALAEQERATDA